MVLEAVVVLEVVVGVMFSDPRFQNESLVLGWVAGGEAIEPFGNLMANQPVQVNPGVIRFRTFLKVKMSMVGDLVAGITWFLSIDEDRCLFVKPNDSWSFRRTWNLLRFCVQQGTQELVSEVPCLLHCWSVVSNERLPLDASEPVGLKDFLELVFNDCLVDLGEILSSPKFSECWWDLELSWNIHPLSAWMLLTPFATVSGVSHSWFESMVSLISGSPRFLKVSESLWVLSPYSSVDWTLPSRSLCSPRFRNRPLPNAFVIWLSPVII